MKQDFTHIVMVLDRSGSMHTVVDDTIGGFNRFVDEQKQVPGEATLTLVQFDDQYEFVHQNKRLSNVPPLDRKTFVPRGSTALLDAIGRAVNETGSYLAGLPESERPAKVICVIITDGGENASKEFSREKVFEMITHQQEKYGWQFVFLGANQDAIQSGASLGIAKGSSMSYAANALGTQAAFKSIARCTSQYRMSGDQQSENFFSQEDRQAQVAAGVK